MQSLTPMVWWLLWLSWQVTDWHNTALFITFTNHPSTLAVALSGLAADMLIPFCSVPVYHKIKFTSSTSDQAQIVDVVHVQPELKDTRGHPILSCFDTVIVCGRRSHAGVQENDGQLLSCWGLDTSNCFAGYQVAQVRVVFEIPKKAISEVYLSLEISPPTHCSGNTLCYD